MRTAVDTNQRKKKPTRRAAGFIVTIMIVPLLHLPVKTNPA
jgi:hypothetical protein